MKVKQHVLYGGNTNVGKNLLEIKDLHVNVEDKEILHGVNLEVGKDEVHVLMGPNGTGKSTLGYAITGHPKYAITSGQIFFDGEDITEMPVNERAKRESSSPSRIRWKFRV